jgi:hypothetical protein
VAARYIYTVATSRGGGGGFRNVSEARATEDQRAIARVAGARGLAEQAKDGRGAGGGQGRTRGEDINERRLPAMGASMRVLVLSVASRTWWCRAVEGDEMG